MVYSKRLGLFNPNEATEEKSDTAELNDGNAFLQHVRQYVHAYTHTYLHTRAFQIPVLAGNSSIGGSKGALGTSKGLVPKKDNHWWIQRGARNARPSLGPMSVIFMQFSAKI